jgi:hypothetical protein
MSKSPRMALTTFLKLIILPTDDKAQELSKYALPGGYDFYWSMKKHVSGVIGGKAELASAVAAINALHNQTEREHNLFGLNGAVAWFAKHGGVPFTPPTVEYKSPGGQFSIKLEPEFAFESVSGRKIVSVWNTQKPELKKKIAGVGVSFMRQHLGLGKYADCTFHILDLRKSKLYGPESIPNNAGQILTADIAAIDAVLKDVLGK